MHMNELPPHLRVAGHQVDSSFWEVYWCPEKKRRTTEDLKIRIRSFFNTTLYNIYSIYHMIYIMI